MSEVVRLDRYRRRAAGHPLPPQHSRTAPASEAAPVFFERRELDRILALYGRMVAVNEWRDYAIDTGASGVEFRVYRNSWDVPAYRLVKRAADAGAGAARFALCSGGETLLEDDRLQPLLAWLERRPPERVAALARSRRARSRLGRVQQEMPQLPL